MKSYYLNTSNFLFEKNRAIREQYDVIAYILSILEYINVRPLSHIRCMENDADVIIYVDKMSRLFWRNEVQIHSIQFPFYLRENEMYLQAEFGDRVIDSLSISILWTILKERENVMSTMESLLDGFVETMYSFDIQDSADIEFYWKLLMHLLLFEAGYLRYDYDDNPERVNPETHPKNHIDIFYSGNSTFKVGLQREIVYEEFKKIMDINNICYYLNIS